jgi:hypothetical protein
LTRARHVRDGESNELHIKVMAKAGFPGKAEFFDLSGFEKAHDDAANRPRAGAA